MLEPDCGSGRGQLTKEGLWEQGDLQKELRRVGNDVVGSWEDEIGSVQCFWIRDKENSKLERGSTGTFAEPTNAQEGVPEAPNGSAIANRVPIEKGVEIRGPSTHDYDRLVS
ncbi:hypothetical protein SLS60_003336 [Paraconiothyrium brasiliense]|uniref:Uncharacterized protein n=1 Tax=Paraconiothyrium brasiliense TaxID=300254 RepID=A0ABR3RVE2_9PLEO